MPVVSVEAPVRAVTAGPQYYFFGYYDKCPWDATGRYLLALQTDFMHRPPTASDTATIGLIDLHDGDRWHPITTTNAWNWQQGTMLHWLPSAPDRQIIYNQRRGDQFIAIVHDLPTGATRELPRPIYALSRDGRQALSLNFARLAHTRPGYGYAGLADPWADQDHPADDGIYWMDLASGEQRLILSTDQVAHFQRDSSMNDTIHWLNHIQFNTDDTRFVFLHRWRRPDGRWWTRMFTANPDGSALTCLADHQFVSHFDWKNNHQILAFARYNPVGNRYFLYTDRTSTVELFSDTLPTVDGHCSFSPDGRWLLTDTYPDSEHMRTLLVYRLADDTRFDIARLYAPPELQGELRCDLHPRWSRDGRQVCIDSAHTGARQVYVVDLAGIVD